MRRILLSCAILGVLTLPAAAASAHSRGTRQPGYLVVRSAAGEGRRPLVTLIVHGFVLGRVKPQNQATIDVIQLPSKGGEGTPTAAPPDVSKSIEWKHLPGHEFTGSGFRFRAPGGFYRVVVRGSGVYLFAGGHGQVKLRGSSFAPSTNGTYSIDGAPFRLLPTHLVKRRLGRG